ncbi:MAG: exo-alpha-sialidase [Candidatus Hydrogenedentes bacterium]|nr:exo-alpha-sialidase [Candidatus Hydrogenedentota bacterium]
MSIIKCLLTLLLININQPIFQKENIFTPNQKHNHGSSIVETPNGSLLVVWFHGSGERTADDVILQGARKRVDSNSWSDPFIMADTPNLPDCNPVLFIDPRGTLWLFWITVQDNQWGSSLLKYRISSKYEKDGPPVWDWQDVIHVRPTNLEEKFLEMLEKSKEGIEVLAQLEPTLREEIETAKKSAQTKLSQRLGWMTRVHPIMLSENKLMLGLYSDVFNCSLAGFTEDWGKTWYFSNPILDTEIRNIANIQPSFVTKTDGTIVAYMRDNGLPKRIRKAYSTDSGMTWSNVMLTEIPNPGSSVECIKLNSGKWLLICNDTQSGRHKLTAYLSDDEGESWKWKRAIEESPAGKGSYSYPSVIQTKDGLIHCTYSCKDEETVGSTIRHAWFNEEWILKGD